MLFRSVFGCWTSASRKAVLPVFEKENGMLYYPTFYEGLEQSKNVIYTGQEATQQIIAGLSGNFEPTELRSGYRERLRTLLEAKLEGREPEPLPAAPAATPAADLMEVLRASVAAAKAAAAAPAKAKAPATKKPAASPKRSAAGKK